MDRIWQQLLLQKVQVSAIDERFNGNRENAKNDPRVGDLVSLGTVATRIKVENDRIVINYEKYDANGKLRVEGNHFSDFCISSMAPSLLRA